MPEFLMEYPLLFNGNAICYLDPLPLKLTISIIFVT